MARGRKKTTEVVEENKNVEVVTENQNTGAVNETAVKETDMEENKDLTQTTEFEGAETPNTENTENNENVENTESVDLNALITVGADGKKIYHDETGKEITCSAFCRAMFEKNMTKKQIADKFDIPYRTVYGACQNLSNDAHGTRTRTASTIKVDEKNQPLVQDADGNFLLNGKKVEGAIDITKFTSVDRDEWIKQAYENGMERAEIAKILNVSHGCVYNVTKELGEKKNTIMIELEDGTSVKRVEYIRELYKAGQSRADIAKLLDIPYNIVYQATKEAKSAAEKLKAAIEAVAKFADSVVDTQAFANALTVLNSAQIKEEEEEKAEESETERAADPAEETAASAEETPQA